MDMKLSKVTLSILVIIFAVAFVASTIIYRKLSKTTKAELGQVIQQQRAEVKRLSNQVSEKEKELNMVKSELDSVKNELNDANKKISALTAAATPEAPTAVPAPEVQTK